MPRCFAWMFPESSCYSKTRVGVERGLISFLVSVIAIVFLARNSTSHKSAQSEIVCRSPFSDSGLNIRTGQEANGDNGLFSVFIKIAYKMKSEIFIKYP